MPSRSSATQWVEIHDFTPGLWTRDIFNAPPGAASAIDGYYPLPQGGLSPFVKEQIDYVTPTQMASDEYILGYYYQPGLGLGGTEFIIATENASNALRLYKREGGFPAGAWTEITSGLPGSWLNGTKVTFAGYRLTGASAEKTYFAYGDAFGGGVFKIDGTTVSTLFNTFRSTHVLVHQDRLVADSNTIYLGSGGNASPRIIFSDPGAEALSASARFIELPTGTSGGVAFIQSYSPSDLVVFMDDGPTVLIQGDLSDPSIRLMDHSQPLRPGGEVPGFGTVGACITPEGVAYQAVGQGIYVTRDGSSYKEISGPLSDTWDGVSGDTTFPTAFVIDRYNSDLVYYDDFLFYNTASDVTTVGIYDFRTGAWFKQIGLGGLSQILGRHQDHIIFFNQGLLRPLADYITVGDLRLPNNRRNSASWTSTPFRSPDSAQVEFRQVEVNVHCIDTLSNDSFTVQIDVLDSDGTTVYARVVTGLTDGSHKLVFPMAVHDDYLRVKVTGHGEPALGGTATAAPTIESIRIGYRPLHRRYRSVT